MNDAILQSANTFANCIRDLQRADYAAQGYNWAVPDVLIKTGKRYMHISMVDVRADGRRQNTGVVAFVDLTNGDVLKPASWKAPAKGTRGNVMAPDGGLSALTPTGRVVYHR